MGIYSVITFPQLTKASRDFPKALWACTIAEIIVFGLVGAIIYVYTGNQYMTAPAFGSLEDVYKKVSFSFMIPTLIFLGVLYASVSARFVFFRIFQNSRHKSEHTLIGWGTWAAILRESSALMPHQDTSDTNNTCSGYLGCRIHHLSDHPLLLRP